MRSEFSVFYLDDGTLGGGNQEDVIDDIKNIEVEAEALGLMLNREMTELICKDPTFIGFVLGALPGVSRQPRECQPLGLSYWVYNRLMHV